MLEEQFSGPASPALAPMFPLPHLFSAMPRGEGEVLRIPSSRVLDTSTFPGPWRRFVEYHTSQAFWIEIVRRFGDDIRRLRPELEQEMDRPMDQWRAVRCGSDAGGEITLECQIIVNASDDSPAPPEMAQPYDDNRLWTGCVPLRAAGDEVDDNDLPSLGFVHRPGAALAGSQCMAGPQARRYVVITADVNHPAFGLLHRGPGQQKWFRFFQRQRNR